MRARLLVQRRRLGLVGGHGLDAPLPDQVGEVVAVHGQSLGEIKGHEWALSHGLQETGRRPLPLGGGDDGEVDVAPQRGRRLRLHAR